MPDIGRQHDIAELKQALKTAPDAEMRNNIKKAGDKIQKEQHDGWIRAARAKMIKERLQGRTENVRDIQDTIFMKEKKGRSKTFGLSISQENWDRIFSQK